MSNAIPPILVQIAADVSQLKAGLAQAEASIKGMNDSVATANTGMNKMMGSAKKMAATLGVAFATTQVIQFGRDVIAAASSMNESLSKVNVVFGQNAKAVEDFASKASSSFGQSKQQALEATGSYGALFTAFGIGGKASADMSMNLTKLASDLASFNNTDVDTALNALRSGLTGEMEPMKKFGSILSETRLKTEALSMGLIKNTSEALTPAAKAQASYSLIMKDTAIQQGDFGRTADGVANRQRTLTAQFADSKASIGQGLLPAYQLLLKVLQTGVLPVFEKVGKFLSDNKEAVTVFGVALGIGAAAWGAYTLAVNAAKIAQAAYNAVAKMNPIGLIVTAVALLAAGFVVLWNKSENFRKMIIEVGKAGLTAIGFVVKVIGVLAEALFNIVTGPAKAFLKVLGFISPDAKKAYNELGNMTKGIGDFFDNAAKKVESYKSTLDKTVNKKITFSMGGVATGGTEAVVPGAQIDTNALKAAEKAAKEKLKIQEKAQKDLKNLQEQFAEIQKNYDEDVSEAHKRELKSRVEAQKQFNDRMKDLNEAFAEQQAEIEADHTKRLTKIENDYAESVIKIKSDFAEKMQQIVDDNDKAIANITSSHFQKIADIQASYAEKLQGIVEKSIARLTDAFANATKTDVGKMFSDMEKAGDVSGEALVTKMKERLTSIKKLAENASALAGAGFSQTFIEQVMALGPDSGNKMAEALLKGSPESNKEMQELFGQLEDVSDSGVDALARSMSSGGKLATKALMDEYKKTQKDLADALQKQNMLYQMALADQAAKFKEAVEKINAELAKALREAEAKLKEQILSENEAYKETLANAQKDYDEAIANAAKTRDEAFADAQEKLVEDIAAAEKTMLEALTKLKKAFEDKLKPVKDLVSGIGSEISGLGGKIEGLLARLASAQAEYEKKAGQNAQGILGGNSGGTPAKSPDDAKNGNINNYNLSIKTETNATPASIENAALGALKFGLPLVV